MNQVPTESLLRDTARTVHRGQQDDTTWPALSSLVPICARMLVRQSLPALADLLLFVWLQSATVSWGEASLASLSAGTLLALVLQRRRGRRADLAIAVGAVLVFGIRGGVLASALALSAPGVVALVLAVSVSWLISALVLTVHAVAMTQPANRLVLQAISVVVAGLLLRLSYVGVLPLWPEETYYWSYADHLATGYLDHPPLVAWLIAGGQLLFGQSALGLRIGSQLAGILMLLFVFQLTKRWFDGRAAWLAVALTISLPYYFITSGALITPDAPLAAAWAASLFGLHQALLAGKASAWFGVGVAFGMGLLSKYTIALLVPAVLLFMLLDATARSWLRRPGPYLACTIAFFCFLPVLSWNAENGWASFAFQGSTRFDGEHQFSLHLLLTNALIVVTPLPVLGLLLLRKKNWTLVMSGEPGGSAFVDDRLRLFILCVVCLPLLVFALNALQHAPRLNWTGPVWLVMLPLLGGLAVRSDAVAGTAWRTVAQLTRQLPLLLLMFYAVLFHFLVLGLPGLRYPETMARVIGWPGATQQLQRVQQQVTNTTGKSAVLVGMDNYFIASQLAYQISALNGSTSAAPTESDAAAVVGVTSAGLFAARRGLMFNFWHPKEVFRGRPLIMVAPRPDVLASARLQPYFERLDSAIGSLPLCACEPGGNGDTVGHYYYRVGYGYRPGESPDQGRD